MNRKQLIIFSTALAVIILAASLFSLLASAGSVSLLDGSLSMTDTQDTISYSNGTVTATAKGGLLSKNTNTITITNSSTDTASLAFDYNVTHSTAFTIDGTSMATSGNFSKLLAPEESLTIAITSKNGVSNLTVTLTLSNISLTVAAESSNVTVSYDSSLGSVTVGGEAAASGSTTEVSLTEGITLVATANGSQFLGWINETDSSILSKDATYHITPAADMAIKAVFAGNSAQHRAWFSVGGSYLYDDLNLAASRASTLANKVIVLMNSGAISAGDYTIPTGATLLIPFDANNTLYTSSPAYYNPGTADGRKALRYSNLPAVSAYRTLTLEEGVNITVNGSISLSGKHSFMGPWNRPGCVPVGPQGMMNMKTNSTITVNSGGNLYAWGYLYGSGSVTLKSGSSAYELIQVSDYPGGSQASGMEHEVFPFSQYYIQNIEVPITYEYGATGYVYTTVYVPTTDNDMTTAASIFPQCVKFISSSDGLFVLSNGASLVKDYIETKDRLMFTQNGNISLGSLTLKFGGLKEVSSSDYILPFASNMTYKVESGTITMDYKMALVPGSEVVINEGAKCQFNSVAYVYDLSNWGNYVLDYGANALKPTLPLTHYNPSGSYRRTASD